MSICFAKPKELTQSRKGAKVKSEVSANAPFASHLPLPCHLRNRSVFWKILLCRFTFAPSRLCVRFFWFCLLKMSEEVYEIWLRNRLIIARCTFSSSWWFRFKGLLGRHSLDPSEAILLRPCQSVHMFFMCFPIDVIFLDRTNRVIAVQTNLRPWRISSLVWKAHGVVECQAGTVARQKINVHAVLRLARTEPGRKPHTLTIKTKH